MTNEADILGRPPARKKRQEPEIKIDNSHDWRGEHHLEVRRGEGSGNHSISISGVMRKLAKMPKRGRK